ncbi:MAG: CehA/McbA family metallohydrolase [Candidatus Aminicenantes bacterium]|nr:CehA/McbA family metallohydrolase [Candidatus Aminicenantes bacterium]
MRVLRIVWILSILAPVSLAAAGRAWNPYGLSEDEVDALRVRHPALREFAEFFTQLLRYEDAPRDRNLAVYRPIRRLAMRRRTVRGSWSPESQDGIQGRISQALWRLKSPELTRIDLNPEVLLTPSARVPVFTAGLENRVLLLVRNNHRNPVELSLSPNGDTLHFPTREASLAPGQVTGIQLRVWGAGGGSLGLRLDVQGTMAELSLPIQWREAARLDLTVRAHDRANFLPARVYVVGSDRLARGPAGTFLRSTWTEGHQYFHTRGASTLVLPSGPARLLVVHGFEHAPVTMNVDLEPGSNQVEVIPQPGIDCSSRGWYSGDIHIHLNLVHKTLDQLVSTQDALLQAEAEDLDVSNLLVCNSLGSITFDRNRFTGALHPLSTADRILYWNEEVRAALYGHFAALNLKTFLEPNFTGFRNTDHAFDYPSNTIQARKGREQGAGIFYVHPVHNPDANDLAGSSAKAVPVDAALGLVDGLEILGYGHPAAGLRLYYRLLNCGFRLAAAAGTDAFNNIRRHKVIGGDRVYVHTGDDFNYDSWVQGLKAGRSFVTNSPLLFFEVDGRMPGAEIALDGPGRVPVQVEAHSHAPMDRLELVFNGKTVHTVKASGNGNHLLFRGSLPITGSGWLAARIQGGPHRLVVNNTDLFAHTTPVYLTVGGKPYADPASVIHFLRWIGDLRKRALSEGLFQEPIQKREVLDQFRRAEAVYRQKLASAEE